MYQMYTALLRAFLPCLIAKSLFVQSVLKISSIFNRIMSQKKQNKITRPITLAIAAMGGQGGGVLSSWIVTLAEKTNYIAQYTSVPGVAQRTGATVYYLELFPRDIADKAKKDPIMALMPVAGDVDIVVAGELMEAGRAITRGFVTPDRTTLIASSHRLYAQVEKAAMGDGRGDSNMVINSAESAAKSLICFDMDKLASEQNSVISSVLFGALAGSNVLPFERKQYEDIIRAGGIAVEANLKGFAAGYEQAQTILADEDQPTTETAIYELPTADHPKVQALLNSIANNFPASSHELLAEGVKRLIDYQDVKYAEQYIEAMQAIQQQDEKNDGKKNRYALTAEMARYLALWMSYEDTIRVADLKTRSQRFNRYRDHVNAKTQDVAHVTEFMHPRVEEICDTLPSWLGSFIERNSLMRKFVNLFCKERQVRTSSLSGFLLLYFVGGLRGIRRSTLRFKREHARMQDWMKLVQKTSKKDYKLAVGLAECQRLIKGYGDTHDRGWHSYSQIIKALPKLQKNKQPSKQLATLREAALADDSGGKLQQALQTL